MDDLDTRETVARAEARIGEIEAFADAEARETALAAVQSLVQLYGEGLARIMAELTRQDGAAVVDALAGDELVGHLLLLHGLHPLDLEARVLQALDEVRPYLASHGGDVEFTRLEADVAHLRLRGSCHGCPSSAMTLKLAIEDALLRSAPDLGGLEVEGVVDEPQGQPVLFVDGPVAPGRSAAWEAVGYLSQFTAGHAVTREIGGDALLLLKLDETLYAYRRRCPACGADVEVDDSSAEELVCTACAARYDARRHGAALDAALSLQPVPLLVGRDGSVRIALEAAV